MIFCSHVTLFNSAYGVSISHLILPDISEIHQLQQRLRIKHTHIWLSSFQYSRFIHSTNHKHPQKTLQGNNCEIHTQNKSFQEISTVMLYAVVKAFHTCIDNNRSILVSDGFNYSE